MKHNFKSIDLTIGLELELQIINPRTQDLTPRAKDLIRYIQESSFKEQIKPEITQSMIEVNSSVHYTPASMHNEMLQICRYLKQVTNKHNVVVCGGGTHPFEHWASKKIFPTNRFRELSKQYGYLAKRFTVFSMHVHVGCSDPNKAIYLTHMLSRYVPQLIALSASSPFYHGINTGYDSTRVNVVNSFPLSGHMPAVKDWSQFCKYFKQMQKLNVIKSMKDFYWDVRPKPEFGTVEVRVCDMPLTLSKAVTLVSYIQTLSHYLLNETSLTIRDDLYQMYDYNRFQAARFGYNGSFINPFTLEQTTIQKDILDTLKLIRLHSKKLGTYQYFREIKSWVKQKENDANYLKNQFAEFNSMTGAVREKCKAWKQSLKN